MATNEDAINRAASPMTYFHNSNESPESRKARIAAARTARSPFLVGSIDEVNRRIGNLERHLRGDSGSERMGSRESVYSNDPRQLLCSAKARDEFQKKEKENVEINQFAGIYAIQSTFSHKKSERLKNISKISMTSKPVAAPATTGKPRFVELQHYPGYGETQVTPLPNVKAVVDILQKVSSGQTKIRNTSPYKLLFKKWFFATCTQEIVQDIYWWIFLEKWQSGTEDQPKYFTRVTYNYIKLMSLVDHPQYRHRFLADFPMLVSQAIYAAYCESFPDSYRLFNEDFKEDIIKVVHEWMTGIRPSPRLWLKWNMEELEPCGIRNREELMTNLKNKTKSNTSTMYLRLLGSTPSQPFNTTSIVTPTECLPAKNQAALPGGEPSSLEESQQLAVATQQRTLSMQRKKVHYATSHSEVKRRKPRRMTESHPIGRGAEFVKMAFNVNGQSPLVAHYLQLEKCLKESGVCHRVQRTEVCSLPPLNATTYREVAKNSAKQQELIHKKAKRTFREGQHSYAKFMRQESKMRKDQDQRQKLLLGNKRVVKQLADLILLDINRDEDSVSARMNVAIERALEAQQ